jgi:hypothetical protein
LLLFSASHAQLARKIVAQASHSHDTVGIHHDVSSTGHKSSSVAPTRSLLSNSFTCPQAFFIFGDSLTDTGNIQLLEPRLTTLNYPYGESYTFTNERGHNRYSDGRLIVDFIGKYHEFIAMFQITHV